MPKHNSELNEARADPGFQGKCFHRMEQRERAGFLGYEAVSQNGTSLEEQKKGKGNGK